MKRKLAPSTWLSKNRMAQTGVACTKLFDIAFTAIRTQEPQGALGRSRHPNRKPTKHRPVTKTRTPIAGIILELNVVSRTASAGLLGQ